MGLNGSGKTTLLRAISGELDYRGSIRLGQEQVSELSPVRLARQLAVVHQRLNLPFQLRVEEFVLMGRFVHLGPLGNYGPEDRKRVGEELERLGIAHLAGRHLDEVSGGELQKALLARALCQDTEWLLLDEPGQQLDPRNREELYQLLQKLAESGRKLLCSTHDREAVDLGKGRVVGLRAGRVVLDEKCPDWVRVWDHLYA